MIGLLEGTAFSGAENPVIVKTGGVGFAVYLPPALLSQIKNNQPITLHTHLHVTDDDLILFGFINRQDLTTFKLLLTVSGIGPKTALLVVDKGTTAIEKAISESNTDFFTGIPRLGKKNAQKIIIELKPKLSGRDSDLADFAKDGETAFAADALKQMGFTAREIRDALAQTGKADLTPEAKIKAALKYLSKK